MKMSRSIVMSAMVAAGLFAMSNAKVIAQELVQNGGFELNGGAGSSALTGWNIVNYGTGSTWYAQTGLFSPVSSSIGVLPPGGSFAAMTDQAGGAPGTTVLYQDFVVPLNVSVATVSFDRWIDNDFGGVNDGPAFFNPDTLDYTTDGPNQQARFDIVKSSADLLSLAGGDVLFTLYSSQGFDPSTQGYDTIINDMTGFMQAHAGETLRIRLAEVNNYCPDGCFGLRFGADNVSFTYEQQAAVPEPSMLILMSGGIGVGAIWVRRRRK